MAYEKKSYLEHVAVKVKDIQWHIEFFTKALGMDIRELHGKIENPEQVWIGGMQLTSSPDFEVGDCTNERAWHIGIFTEDLEDALKEVYSFEGVMEMPQGRNWFSLPDGLSIELMQASENSVQEILKIDPRA
jgi:predicted enzyme related to lactoylglutathione lyase